MKIWPIIAGVVFAVVGVDFIRHPRGFSFKTQMNYDYSDIKWFLGIFFIILGIICAYINQPIEVRKKILKKISIMLRTK